MTADIRTAGAASHAAEGWHTINWKSAYRIVCRLQARIVKAIQEGRWGKVKALQYLLTHSFSGKALAIRRVTENQGKGTPGVDREIWDTPEPQPRVRCRKAASCEGRSRGLSCMKGNFHVQFLGDCDTKLRMYLL